MNNKTNTLLTAENLKELEEHCKRQVQRYETGKREKEEHLIILELLYSYNQNEAKANKYDSLVENIKDKIEANAVEGKYFAGKLEKEKASRYFYAKEELQELLDTKNKEENNGK